MRCKVRKKISLKLEIKVENSTFYRERAGLLFSDSATSIDILCKI